MSNRLAAEKSPYLLQHKDNPVDWWPWSEDAFAQARSLDRPVLLSIGYATCHWCHVMERESFESDEVAALMNEAFINIKVDREERPDIDTIYMTVCQLLTRHGGWPLTILMTPEGEPFFAGTYIPKETRQGRMGMLDLIPQVKKLWTEARARLLKDAAMIRDALAQVMDTERQAGDLGPDLIDQAYAYAQRQYDPVYGGFGSAPKFPPVNTLRLLMRYWWRTGSQEALAMVEHTLRCMRRGGIYDQVGYGFHRYSTDRTWTLPHFEKMLYDQAMLTLVYTEAYQITRRDEYACTVREIITYVLRDLRDADGAFHTAEDADSEGREGKFYVWHEHELEDVLDRPEFEAVRTAYNTHRGGNFHDEATRRKTGENILFKTEGAAQLSRAQTGLLKTARRKLLQARDARIRPLLDDKVLTDWNGLMIAALARAGRVLGVRSYLDAACSAASFIKHRLQADDGAILHRWRDGQPAITGMLDDYAYLIWGLIELYQATFDPNHLSWALRLARICTQRFRKKNTGLFYLAASEDESLLVRPSQAHDAALPSGAAVMMMNLLRLGRLCSEPELEQVGHAVSEHYAGSLRNNPAAYLAMVSAVDYALGPSSEVVIAGDPDREDTQAMLRDVQGMFAPNAVLVFVPDGNQRVKNRIEDILPHAAAFQSQQGAPLAYVCREYACQAPTSDVEAMLNNLRPENRPIRT